MIDSKHEAPNGEEAEIEKFGIAAVKKLSGALDSKNVCLVGDNPDTLCAFVMVNYLISQKNMSFTQAWKQVSEWRFGIDIPLK